MWAWLRSWFQPTPVSRENDNYDLMMQEVLRRAFSSGNIIVATRDDTGHVTFEEFPAPTVDDNPEGCASHGTQVRP